MTPNKRMKLTRPVQIGAWQLIPAVGPANRGGERLNPATPAEWLGLLFFPLGICAGMILAWWREGLGGSMTVGSLLVFYMIHLATAGTFPKGWAWVAFAAPGFLYLP